MKNAIFFCDIAGTLTDGSENDFIELIYNLEELKKNDGLDTLYFSLISSEDISYVIKFYDILKPLLIDSSIEIGPMFSSGIMFFNGQHQQYDNCKVDQIIHFIRKILPRKAYFADDTFMYHKILNKAMEQFPDVEFQSFILGTDDATVTPYFSEKKGIGEGGADIFLDS